MTHHPSTNYLSHLKQLRLMAEACLQNYDLNNYQLKFINHGENTTYKIITPNKSFLLRLHRPGYHTKEALNEELAWLSELDRNSDLRVQKIVLSKGGQNILLQKNSTITPRYCSLLEWQPGRFKLKGLNVSHMKIIGQTIAKLHHSSTGTPVKNRIYWNAKGLMGRQSKFGAMADLCKIAPEKAYILEECRNVLFKKLRSYEKSCPEKMGLIHADLHFKNMLWHQGNLIPIDFDDCGLGFHVYDLAVILYSLRRDYKGSSNRSRLELEEALLAGYSSIRPLIQKDLVQIEDLIVARKLGMLVWLNSKKDNSKLAAILPGLIEKYCADLEKFLN